MSHQRYPSHDGIKEPHSISLKVLRLSRPSLVVQHPVDAPLSQPGSRSPTAPGSLAYSSEVGTNSDPFLLSPVLNLPPSFGSAYVGETFSCTLCANHDAVLPPPGPGESEGVSAVTQPRKQVRDVRIEAEMKTPSSASVAKLDMTGAQETDGKGVDLEPGGTLQRIVSFDLKEQGNHVLAVTVSYYEATETSGRTRTFRKLYQFICKPALIVRTKVGTLSLSSGRGMRRWALEAQLENCSEDAIQLETVGLELEPGLADYGCNWEASGSPKPIIHPGEVEQACFVVEEAAPKGGQLQEQDERLSFGVLTFGWRGEMGNKGTLATGKLSIRSVKAA